MPDVTIPAQLWSQFDTDVGLVLLASPVEVHLKPHVKLPWCREYVIKPEAELGIAPSIECLIATGVLTVTNSKCNTPLLPVLKADKQKWWLVHDLRAVNHVVEDT